MQLSNQMNLTAAEAKLLAECRSYEQNAMKFKATFDIEIPNPQRGDIRRLTNGTIEATSRGILAAKIKNLTNAVLPNLLIIREVTAEVPIDPTMIHENHVIEFRI